MPDYGFFPDALASLASWLLTYALHSTVLLIVAWAGSRWMARRRPAVEEALWKVALVGGLLTASLQLAAGLEPLLGQWTMPTPAAEVAAGTLPVAGGSAPLPAAAAAAAPTAASSGLAWTAWMVIGWTVAALGFLASLGVSWRRLRGRLADRREITDGPLPAMLAELRRLAGYERPVRLSSSQRLAVPIAIGILRPEICLPSSVSVLSPAEMRCILGHELAHLVRRDPAWHLLARVVEGVFFFQPLHRLAGRRLHRLSEYLCDDWTAERTGAPLELARCLTRVAERLLARPRLFPVASMARSSSELERRVRRLLEDRDLRLRRAPVRALVLGMITALLLVSWVAPGWSSDPAAEAEEEAAPQTEPLAEEATQTEQVDARELEEVRAQLEEVRGQLQEARKQAAEIRAHGLDEVRAQLQEARLQAERIRDQEMEELRAQFEEVRRQAEQIRGQELEEVRAQMEEARREAEQIRDRELAEVRAQMEEARREAEQIRDRELAEVRAQMEEARRQAEDRRQAEEEARRKQREEKQREAEESGDPEEG